MARTESISSFTDQLENVTELISLPEIYLKIHALMDDTTSDIDDFARVIRLDSNLTARVLKAVNSAYFGFSGEITSISRAVNLIGIQQLHIMVLSISAVTAVSTLQFPKDIIDLKSFWKSSLLAGTLSQLLAQRLSIRRGEQFFILGLLHEIGHLVLYANFPDLVRKANALCGDNDLSISEAECRLLGCHYGDIGATLMDYWKLPEVFQAVTRHQPDPRQARESITETSIVHIAHAYAAKQFTATGKAPESTVSDYAWETTQLTEDQVDETLESAMVMSSEMEKVIL